MNKYYTQTQLLNISFSVSNDGLLDGVLIPGLYVLAGTSKIGKSIIATCLTNAVAKGEIYLGRSNPKGKVLYFDNDNYQHETQGRLKALGFTETDDIEYIFEGADSIDSINDYIKRVPNLNEYKLVVIDCYVNLYEVTSGNDNYNEVYVLLKELCKIMIDHNLVGVLLHHTKKAESKGDQDSVLGSRALTGAVTGTIIVDVANEYSQTGYLKFILRNKKMIIPIRKDNKDIKWDLNDEEEPNEDISKSLLSLINKVVSIKNNKLEGTCQEIVNKAKMEINPAGLTKFLKRHEVTLEENHITFEQKRLPNKRIIILKYTAEDKE